VVSPQERHALKAVRNFTAHLHEPRLGPNAECLLAFLRGLEMPAGKSELGCDPRQRGALLRARSDLDALTGMEWAQATDEQRKTGLERVLG
jgi:hypothetical protein